MVVFIVVAMDLIYLVIVQFNPHIKKETKRGSEARLCFTIPSP
jgi:hypothetical protein